jgi:hypothetical protein
MFTRPADLADDVVSAVVEEAWQLRIRRIDYAPVGFGSYHCTLGPMGIGGLSLPMTSSLAEVILPDECRSARGGRAAGGVT